MGFARVSPKTFLEAYGLAGLSSPISQAPSMCKACKACIGATILKDTRAGHAEGHKRYCEDHPRRLAPKRYDTDQKTAGRLLCTHYPYPCAILQSKVMSRWVCCCHDNEGMFIQYKALLLKEFFHMKKSISLTLVRGCNFQSIPKDEDNAQFKEKAKI
jgi:hypothetical protein